MIFSAYLPKTVWSHQYSQSTTRLFWSLPYGPPCAPRLSPVCVQQDNPHVSSPPGAGMISLHSQLFSKHRAQIKSVAADLHEEEHRNTHSMYIGQREQACKREGFHMKQTKKCWGAVLLPFCGCRSRFRGELPLWTEATMCEIPSPTDASPS